jgi:HEPN domain-containing protein
MIDPVKEWVEKAEEDYRVALALMQLSEPANNAVCFHAQQCVEKYLKAVLQSHRAEIRKIHALPALLGECAEFEPSLTALRPGMIRLSVYAVEFRYPGESASGQDAQDAIDIMQEAREALRTILLKSG